MKKIYFRWRHNNKLDYVVIDDRKQPEKIKEQSQNREGGKQDGITKR